MELEDALSPAFIIEELEDGRYTVLVPSVPTPAAGALFILPRERVHPVDVPFTPGREGHLQMGRGRRSDGPRRVGRILTCCRQREAIELKNGDHHEHRFVSDAWHSVSDKT